MNHHHRDVVLRAFFAGKDWDENPEFKLKRALVLNVPAELSRFSFLVDDEWEVEPGNTNLGRGDLLFTDGEGAFAVVEVKFIDLGRPGVFRVGPDGRFEDNHGGHGFVPGDCIRWFTEAALRRGIGWHFIQTYRHAGSNKVVGRFKVHRTISLSGAIEVRKVPLRL